MVHSKKAHEPYSIDHGKATGIIKIKTIGEITKNKIGEIILKSVKRRSPLECR